MPHRQMIIAAIALCILAPALGAAEPQGVELINSRIHWRYCMVRKTEQVRLKSGEVQAVRFVGRQRTMQKVEPSRSALPPDNWREPDFDDAKWPRRRLPVMSTRGRIHSLMCARAQFRVGDPARIGGLTLAISYRGGVVAHLNGKELTRAHMPKGKIDADTPSADYTKDAYLDPDGFLLRLGWGDTGKYRDRFAGRDRHLKAFTVPAAAPQGRQHPGPRTPPAGDRHHPAHGQGTEVQPSAMVPVGDSRPEGRYPLGRTRRRGPVETEQAAPRRQCVALSAPLPR